MHSSHHPIRRRLLIAGAASFGAAVAAVALYFCGAGFLTGRSTPQPFAAAALPEGTGSASADAFKFSVFDQPRALPELRFADGEGRSMSLQDLRGRPILLDIWATWCAPCRKEMPALDRLQAELGASRLLVLPLSIDRQGLPVVKQFYQELGLKGLGIYVDQFGRAASSLNSVAVPTTLLIDRDGREVARKIGPAEWDSPEMIALIREHLGLPAYGRQASP